MLSANPHSGFYEATTSRTLDQSGGNAVSSNQGGICVVAPAPETYSLQGSMIGRADKNGPQGDGINKDVCFTLNCADHHAVAVPEGEHYSTSKNSHHTVAAHEKTNTLVATDWKDPPLVNDAPNDEPLYIVRRLTPVECARLQGFPDWWCADLAVPEPTDAELSFWTEVWETWHSVTNPDGKPKTEKQIRKWLADPYSDSAEYKLWGNGIHVGCAYFVLAGIAWAAEHSHETAETAI
jgi:DNA (cytosine-5)-methyltransferase 1